MGFQDQKASREGHPYANHHASTVLIVALQTVFYIQKGTVDVEMAYVTPSLVVQPLLISYVGGVHQNQPKRENLIRHLMQDRLN